MFFARRPPQKFEQTYQCFSMAVVDKLHLDFGDKILLPPSALNMLSRMEVEYPLLFELSSKGRKVHCGVREFSAEEGKVHLPYLMMQTLNIDEGSLLLVRNVSLPKATFLKVRAQSVDFLNVKNHRATLEVALRDYTCVTVGDTIKLVHNDKPFFLDVMEVRPNGFASIVETDVELDFDEPLGYQEYIARERAQAAATAAVTSQAAVQSTPRELQRATLADTTPSAKEASFVPFGGNGRRIDGKEAGSSPAVSSNSSSSSSSSAISSSSLSMSSAASVASPSSSAASTSSKDTSVPGFQSRIGNKFSTKKAGTAAFQGKGHSLT